MRTKGRKNPYKDNSHRWVVSYADFITLLFAFFVVMYSMSQVNQSKYRVLSEALHKTFPAGKLEEAVEGSNGFDGPSQTGSGLESIIGGDALSSSVGSLTVTQLQDGIQQSIEKLNMQNDIQVSGDEERIEIIFNSNILFLSGSSQPNYTSEVVFEEMARLIRPYSVPIDIEGHTDDVPISNKTYASNWVLSAARAANVVMILQDFGVNPDRLSAIGYGEYRPLIENNSDENRAKNRRVVMILHIENKKIPAISASNIKE